MGRGPHGAGTHKSAHGPPQDPATVRFRLRTRQTDSGALFAMFCVAICACWTGVNGLFELVIRRIDREVLSQCTCPEVR